MNGVIAVDKPEGFTSFDVIAKLRGILKTRKLGHSGTLDPMATGVLPVFAGCATKATDLLPDREKRYIAGFAMGFSTDTQDITGKQVSKSDKAVALKDISAAVKDFIGEIDQLPPMYSAVKVNGRRLYDIARSGGDVERTPRKIEIHSIEIVSYSEQTRTGVLDISCSKGTYIRTLINDIGSALGTGGVMTSLRRTYSQGFDISDCHTLAEIEKAAEMGEIRKFTISVESCFENYPKIELDTQLEHLYKNGVKLESGRVGVLCDGLYRVCGTQFLGLGQVENGVLRVKKNFTGDDDN